jgi:glycosyltransferase involved in cell wall biosynthesis
MRRRKVLYVLHNHPSVKAGGAETYAAELFESLRDSPEFEPLLLARIGTAPGGLPAAHPGTPITMVDGASDQYFLFTSREQYDFFHGTYRNAALYHQHLDRFLRAHLPAVVHFQHTLFIGYDAVSQVRRSLPGAAIVYTLHEFLPICNRDGQLLRMRTDEPCREESPRRCHECFPETTPQQFFLRKRMIQSHLSKVDRFISPSRFLRERYVDWGIPPERIVVEENARVPVPRAEKGLQRPTRKRIGFFGQLLVFKGVNVLLEAMRILAKRDVDVELRLHGVNLEEQPAEFQSEFRELLAPVRDRVILNGPYEQRELPKLMADIDWVAVPSIWWENSPLVIQEAFRHGRPVICSDIGGMAEKVSHEVNGLHFRASDPVALAATIERAVSEEGLWDRLRAGVPEPHTMDEHVETLTEIYRDVLRRLTGRRGYMEGALT